MSPDLLIERAHILVAIALLTIAAVTAWTSSNVAKRVAASVIAGLAVVLGLAALRAPEIALVAAISLSLAHVLVGAALLVRLQEAYGGVETPEIDQADQASEPGEDDAA